MYVCATHPLQPVCQDGVHVTQVRAMNTNYDNKTKGGVGLGKRGGSKGGQGVHRPICVFRYVLSRPEIRSDNHSQEGGSNRSIDLVYNRIFKIFVKDLIEVEDN